MMYALYGKKHYGKQTRGLGPGAISRLTERQKEKRPMTGAPVDPSGLLKDTTPTASGSMDVDNEIIFIEDSEDEDDTNTILVKEEDKAATATNHKAPERTAQLPAVIYRDSEFRSTL